MRKLSSLVVGTALAGALAAGVAAAPAQAATASTASTASASQAQFTKHWFSGYSDSGRGESRGERSYYQGNWYFSNGRYYFDINTFDRDHDGQNTYIDFWKNNDSGWHEGHRFSTRGHNEWRFSYGSGGGFDGYKIRIGEGSSRDFDWSNYYRHNF